MRSNIPSALPHKEPRAASYDSIPHDVRPREAVLEVSMLDFRSAIREFEKEYSPSWEDEAQGQRGEFLERFPRASLPELTLKKYSIGQNGQENFCYWIEQGTRKWARIVGATADKFGIYFGRTKSDGRDRFRYTLKYGRDLPREGAERQAFRNVRGALTALVASGADNDFAAIDRNPLSPMFKAKILSLYFPATYLAICSREHLEALAEVLELDAESPSRIQHDALKLKRSNEDLRHWSNLKFAAFLFEQVLGQAPARRTKKPRLKRQHRVVDFEALQRKWRVRGKQSEAYALQFERARLAAAGMRHLVPKIKDCTERPGFGYDFSSFTTEDRRRHIEVKSLSRVNKSEALFFLSAHERHTAMLSTNRQNYYFYFVLYSNEKKPIDVEIWNWDDLSAVAALEPQSYLVRLPR